MDDTMKVKDQCQQTTTSNLSDDNEGESINETNNEGRSHHRTVDLDTSSDNSYNCCSKIVYHVEMLPDEILEFILTYLPPYKDLENCSLVCKHWNDIVKSKFYPFIVSSIDNLEVIRFSSLQI